MIINMIMVKCGQKPRAWLPNCGIRTQRQNNLSENCWQKIESTEMVLFEAFPL